MPWRSKASAIASWQTRMRCSSLVHLGRLYSARMSVAVDLSVTLYFYGTCISYLILIGGSFSALLNQTANNKMMSRAEVDSASWASLVAVHADSALLLCFTLFIMLPLLIVQSLGAFILSRHLFSSSQLGNCKHAKTLPF